jgi:purine nucleoside permease
MLRSALRICAAVGLLALLGASGAPAIIAPKVVVVAMFEIGKDSGDKPGEFQFWVERERLTRLIPLPAAFHGVRTNADASVIGIVTGRGNTSSASSIMALGLDPRFDLRKSYWVIAGIAGIDPKKGSIGSAVWTDAVVDGDLSHEIDAREMPPGWSTGFVPLDRTQPYEQPVPSGDEMVYRLNPALLRWAYALTRNTKLVDNARARARRMLYTGYPRAQAPPSVLVGADVSSSRFWAGALSDRWANDWTRYYTHGRSTYVTTAMEDAGTLHSLTALARAGRVDINRVLLLRAASDYDMQRPGESAEHSLNSEKYGAYSAYLPALEGAYRVGSRVVHALVAGWPRYETQIP